MIGLDILDSIEFNSLSKNEKITILEEIILANRDYNKFINNLNLPENIKQNFKNKTGE